MSFSSSMMRWAPARVRPSPGLDESRDVIDLVAAVAPLTAARAVGHDDAFGVESSHERRLDFEQRRDLADGVERGGVIGTWRAAAHPTRRRRRHPTLTRHDLDAPTDSRSSSAGADVALASIDDGSLRPSAMSTRRGLACSRTGTRRRSTPSV
jgi:hypothetical protein